jgi:hypothetical protein
LNTLEKFNAYVQKNGLDILLPQNMSQEIFNDILKGVYAYKDHKYNSSVPCLLVAVLSIKAKSLILKSEHDLQVSFKLQDEVMVEFDNYVLTILLEEQRRKGILNFTEDSLPTLENILDNDREVKFIDL